MVYVYLSCLIPSLSLWRWCTPLSLYRGYSKLRTHTALGSFGSSMPGSIGSSQGRGVSLISSNPCIWPHQIGQPGLFSTPKLTGVYRRPGPSTGE